MDRKMTRAADLELRSIVEPVGHRADGETMTVAGYAAVFGERADIGGCFYEVFAPGAFGRSILTDDVRAYFDHDKGRVLGRKSAGTLRMKEDARGLAVEIDLPDTSDGRDVRALIARGDISGMSIGFIARKQAWDESGPVPVRTVQEATLIHVSAVSEPAYDGTSIALRSLSALREGRREANFDAARRRIAARRAAAEAKFRRII